MAEVTDEIRALYAKHQAAYLDQQIRDQEKLQAEASRAAALRQRGFFNQEGLADEKFWADKAAANAKAKAEANAAAQSNAEFRARGNAMKNEIARIAEEHKAAAKAAANATAAMAAAKVAAAKEFEAKKPGFFGSMWPYEDVLDQLIMIAQHRQGRPGDKLAETAAIIAAMAERMNNPTLPDEERLITRILYIAGNLVNASFGGAYYNAPEGGKQKVLTTLSEAVKLKGEMSGILMKYPKNKGIKNMLDFMFTNNPNSLARYAVIQADKKGVIFAESRALMFGGARTRKNRKSSKSRKSRKSSKKSTRRN